MTPAQLKKAHRKGMKMEILFSFTTPNGEYPGAFFRDYFTDDGYARAQEAATETEVQEILEYTYLGPDDDGVGVKWQIVIDETGLHD
jgi:hypothetical protein